MTNSLEEYAKICSLIASCNDIINGKFILAYNKISALLKNLTASKDVYNLLATHLNNFDFEREFSRAQLRSAKEKTKFVLPEAPDKILPFVFCVLVNINNHTIDLDQFITEFFPSENGNHAEEFQRFAKEIILPFRDLIAKAFDVPEDSISSMKVQPLKTSKKEEEEIMKKAEELEKKAELDEEFLEELEEEFEDDDDEDEYEEDDEEFDDEKEYPELTAERIEEYFDEIASNCNQILAELPYEKRLKENVKDDVEYIAETILHNCQQADLTNTNALITALDYVAQKSKTIKIYTKEMKNVLACLYEGDDED
ncbi:MAG: hypothetical protein IKV69_00675 [Clostridia bacterium]|nr:hypothetical protein [Clostridia bacterium]